MNKKELANAAVEALERVYPDAVCSLEYEKPYELLISTRLSAQCTDARVNIVTRELFAKYPTLQSIAEADLADIETIIYRSLLVKKKIVEADEREAGARRALNFGHTIGHGIEAVKGVRGRRTNGLYHGECVALGMLPMIEDRKLQKRARAVLRRLELPVRTGLDKQKVLAQMQHDKKGGGDTITVIRVPGLGCWRADTIPMSELPALLGLETQD